MRVRVHVHVRVRVRLRVRLRLRVRARQDDVLLCGVRAHAEDAGGGDGPRCAQARV